MVHVALLVLSVRKERRVTREIRAPKGFRVRQELKGLKAKKEKEGENTTHQKSSRQYNSG